MEDLKSVNFENEDNNTFKFDESSDVNIGFIELKAFLAVLCVAGLLTNGALLYVLCKTKALLTAPNIFILNLAVANLFVVLIYLPFSAATYSLKSYPLSETMCKITESSYEISIAVSSFTLIALSAHSFLATTTETLPTGKGNYPLLGIWVLGVVVALPTILFSYVHINEYNTKDSFCLSTSPKMEEIRIIVRIVANIAMPLAAVGYFYCSARRKRTANFQSCTQREFSKLALGLLAVLVICFLPANAFDLFFLFFHGYNLHLHIVHICSYVLTLVYSCVNPVVIFCAIGDFRLLFKQHLLCWCVKSNQEAVSDREVRLEPLMQGAP